MTKTAATAQTERTSRLFQWRNADALTDRENAGSRSALIDQFLRFLAVGVVNTIIGMGCIYFCMWTLKLDFKLANGAGYAVGSCVSFALNRLCTFSHRGSVIGGLIRWVLVVAVAYVLNLAVVIGLHDNLGISADLAQLGGMAIYVLSSFVGARLFAFRQPSSDFVKGRHDQSISTPDNRGAVL